MQLLVGRMGRKCTHRPLQPVELLRRVFVELGSAPHYGLTGYGFGELLEELPIARTFESSHDGGTRLATLGRQSIEERRKSGPLSGLESVCLRSEMRDEHVDIANAAENAA